MKKSLLFITAALGATLGMAQQNTVPNGNFENWVSLNYLEPEFYETGNQWSIKKGYSTSERVTDAYHGTYALKMTTQLSGSDTLQAYTADGDPGNSLGTGIPYTETPTGIRGYYKCNVMPGDTALIFVEFRKLGTVIGGGVFKITGTQSNYTLFNYNFSPSLFIAPDTVVWGAASSNLMAPNFPGIPGSMLQLDSVSFTGVANQPAMMNGDFESWINKSILTLPGWEYSDPGSYNPQSTDAYAGQYAIHLQTTMETWGINSGSATTGQPTPNGTAGGHPYNKIQDTLAFYYKYQSADVNDSADVNVMFKLNGTWIGIYSKRLGNAASYTYVEIPFLLGQAPDSAVVSLSSSKWPAMVSYAGAIAKFDDVHFKSQAAPVAGWTGLTTVCANQQFTLTDTSTNIPSGWIWTMPGATPATSNVANPTLSYAAAGTYTITLVASNGAGASAPVSKTITVLAQPTVGISFTPNDTICVGTSVTLSGTGAASYAWDNGVTDAVAFTPTATASYIVTGTDANACTNMDTITVVVNALPNVGLTATPNDTVCDGDMITLSGTGAVNYTWDGGVTDGVAFTANSSASYIVTGTDANGCANNDTVDVVVNSLPTVGLAITPNDTVCEGTMVTLNGSGAVSYAWTGGVTDNTPFAATTSTSYIVTGTDANGCSNKDTVDVQVNALPNVTFAITPNDTVCEGTMVTLTGSGVANLTWTGGITDATAFAATSTASYIVSGTDANGCSNSDTADVVVNALPSVSFAVSPNDTVCDTTMITLSGTGAVSYNWDNGVTDGVLFSPASGNYIVTGTDANGCTNADTAVITVTICTGIEGINTANYFSVYPNPINENATIQLNGLTETATMNVVDVTGRIVRSSQIAAGTNMVSFTRDGLENGIYFIRISRNDKVIATTKVIVE